jgi:hypothetical protein
MKIKALVYQHIVETYEAELSEKDVQEFLDSCSLVHNSGVDSGKLVTSEEVQKVFLGKMQNFLVTDSCGKSIDLYTTIIDWATNKTITCEKPDREIEDSDSSVTMI